MDDAVKIGLLASLFGACVGSFLNVVIYRLPIGLSVNEPKRSFCPLCKAAIRSLDNLPVISWLLLGGKCRSCKSKIPWRYPFVEFLTAVFFFLAFFECLPAEPSRMDFFSCTFWAILFAVLISISYIDFDHRLILDEINVSFAVLVPWAAFALPGIPIDSAHLTWLTDLFASLGGAETSAGLGLTTLSAATLLQLIALTAVGGVICAFIFRALSLHPDPENPRKRTWWEARWAFSLGAASFLYLGGVFLVDGWISHPQAMSLLASLVGTAAGAGVLYAIGVVGSWVFRKPAMGFGDVKFLGLLGGLLGWQAVGLSLFIACILGSVIGIGAKFFTRDPYIPFGPFLAMGATAMILWGDWVQVGLQLYLALFQQQPLSG